MKKKYIDLINKDFEKNYVRNFDVKEVLDKTDYFDKNFSKDSDKQKFYIAKDNISGYKYRKIYKRLSFFNVVLIVALVVVVILKLQYGDFRKFDQDIINKEINDYVTDNCDKFELDIKYYIKVYKTIKIYIYSGTNYIDDSDAIEKIYFYIISQKDDEKINIICNGNTIDVNNKKDYGILTKIDIDNGEEDILNLEINVEDNKYNYILKKIK